jgi:hypothetical protein
MSLSAITSWLTFEPVERPNDMISPGSQDNHTMSLERVREAITRNERDMYERERRAAKKEKEVAEMERH